jgi:hypothetical protein
MMDERVEVLQFFFGVGLYIQLPAYESDDVESIWLMYRHPRMLRYLSHIL